MRAWNGAETRPEVRKATLRPAITGSSSGFGKGASLDFARSGANVVLAARRDNLFEDVARDCESAGVRAVVVPTEVGKADQIQKLAQTAVNEFGHFDVWVNNAGPGRPSTGSWV